MVQAADATTWIKIWLPLDLLKCYTLISTLKVERTLNKITQIELIEQTSEVSNGAQSDVGTLSSWSSS